MKTIVLLFCVAALCYCNKPQETDVPTANIDIRNLRKEGLGKFLEYSHYVVLKTPDSLPIGSVNKLQIKDRNLYISDRISQRAYVFDSVGSLLTVIDRQGRAGNEYTTLTDIEADPNTPGAVCVYDGQTGKIFRYSPDGKTCLSTEQTAPGTGFKFLNGYTAVNCGNGWEKDNFAYHLYRNGECIYRTIPFDESLRGHLFTEETGKSVFYAYRDRIYMSTISDDVVYRIDPTDGKTAPFLKFDFGKGIRPDKTYSRDYLNKLMSEVPLFPTCFYDFGDTCLIMYVYDRKPCAALVSPAGEVRYNGLLGKDANGLSIYPIPYLDSDKTGLLASLVNSESLELYRRLRKDADTQLLDRLIAETDGNPILLFYRPVNRPD